MEPVLQTAKIDRRGLDLDPRDIEVLAYIHANKFITTRLFHHKFLPSKCYSTACNHLKRLERAGLILRTQKMPCEDTFYYLTRPAIHQLLTLSRILVSHEVRSPHINPYEREHDKRVLEMRIQIEGSPALTDLTWLSDYEMRCGVRLEWKKVLEKGQGFGLETVKLHRYYKRTPDGFFQASIQGTPHAFVLEYEHTPYNRLKMAKMILNLTRDFPGAYRLVVSRDYDHAVRMFNGMDAYLKNTPREHPLWAFSYYEKVMARTFTQVPWTTLEGKYLPFVTLPEKSQTPEAVEQKAVNQ